MSMVARVIEYFESARLQGFCDLGLKSMIVGTKVPRILTFSRSASSTGVRDIVERDFASLKDTLRIIPEMIKRIQGKLWQTAVDELSKDFP